jgi:hypothetical protein
MEDNNVSGTARQLLAVTLVKGLCSVKSGWERWGGRQTGAAPSLPYQRGSCCVYNKIRSNTFNSVTAMKLKVGLKNPRRHLTGLWKSVPKMLILAFTVLFKNENKVGYTEKVI